jgi:integrase/recombinase XerD
VLKAFFKWYGDELDIKIKTGRQLPRYVESLDVEKLVNAMRSENKRTHKKLAERDILLVELAIHTGLRRMELANLNVGDIDIERKLLNVKAGKGNKDRTVNLSSKAALTLAEWVKDKPKEDSIFHLSASTVSGKIK